MSGVDDNSVDGNGPDEKAELLRAFVRARGREKRALFKALRPRLSAADMTAVAPAVRDPSPKLSARVTALLARFGLRELFEAQLEGLKSGKIAILRRHFEKILDARDD